MVLHFLWSDLAVSQDSPASAADEHLLTMKVALARRYKMWEADDEHDVQQHVLLDEPQFLDRPRRISVHLTRLSGHSCEARCGIVEKEPAVPIYSRKSPT